jgi:hypothetical protein
MITQEAQQELAQVKREAEAAQDRSYDLRRQGYNAEAGKWSRKWAQLYDKQTTIEKLGLSTNEKKAVLLSLPAFTKIHGDRSLGSSSVKAVGFVPKLNKYVLVEYTHYSSFMGNVRGMASLANKKDIDSIRVIDKSVYERITGNISSRGTTHETHFMGASQKKINGQIINKDKPNYSNLQYLR